MNLKEIFRTNIEFTKTKKGPVSLELENLNRVLETNCDVYLTKLKIYLEYALECGLDTKLVRESCLDLALTMDDSLMAELNRVKVRPWQDLREYKLSIDRDKRVIEMKLDPVYFAAILSGAKIYEGRAYDPMSDKDYSDIRSEDIIKFTINMESPNLECECKKLKLALSSKMECSVSEVHFSSTVHGMYQFCPTVGAEFQPMVQGPSELLELQRAAVYYSFPRYPELIKQNGFIGIELKNPTLI